NDVWTAYDWPGQAVADRRLMADTRGCRLAVGPDGKLYLAGESFGGNPILARGSRDLDENLPMPKGDKYHSAVNTRANPIAFLAPLDPKTGKAAFFFSSAEDVREPGRDFNRAPYAAAVEARGSVLSAGPSRLLEPGGPGE